MKQLIMMIATLLIITDNVSSQISKGNVLLGGTFSFFANKSKEDNAGPTRVFGMEISPKTGVALTDKWVIGGGIAYEYGLRKGGHHPAVSYSSYRGTNHALSSPYVFVNYYKKIAGRFYFVPEFRVGNFIYFNNSKTVTQPGDITVSEKVKTAGIGFWAIPAFAYFINHRILFTASYGWLGFNTQNGTRENHYSGIVSKQKINYTNFAFDFSASSLQLGLTFILNNKEKVE